MRTLQACFDDRHNVEALPVPRIDRCPSEPGGALNTSCTARTAEEREHLALWIACECNRPHTF